jgi:hypothetical protein
MEAGGANPSRIECVPFMAAGAEPFVFLAWRPATQWAPDARARWIATLSFVYFTIQNDGGFGGVTQENASPLLGKQTILNFAEFHRFDESR